MLPTMLSALPKFIAYLGVALSILTAFVLTYTWITPYKELELIRQGNAAASTALAGTMIGYALPISNVIAHSDSLIDLAAWSIIACLVQLLAYLAIRLTIPSLIEDIPAGRVAPAILLAALSVAVGIINAACMTY